MGLPGPHARSGIHPIDRRGPLQRRLHDQLALERVSGNPRTHLRPPVRAGLPARPRRGNAGGDLPPEARRRRLQGRHHAAGCRSPSPKNGKRIALVGGGPASLAVARDLAPLGYHCTVFDQDPKAGGMMRTQIPKFRLPDSVIDEETDYILNLGIEFKGGQRIDSMKTLLARELTTRSSSAPARRAAASSTFPAARKPPRTSTSASTGCPTSRSATSTRSASASSCSAAATPRWTAAAPRAASAARTSR